MRQRLPLVLSALALAVSILGATPLGQAAGSQVVKFAQRAGVAQRAKKADFAQRAKKADVAQTAKKAAVADQAKRAKTADQATKAKTADTATQAKEAQVADDAKKVAGHEVSSTPEPGKLVPVAASGMLPAASVDLSGLYTKAESDTRFLAGGSRGVAFAGARITDMGSVLTFFNRSGGAPTVSHTAASGIYTVTFPGIDLSVNTHIVEATVIGSFAVAQYRFISVDSASGAAIVQVKNQVGNFADENFALTVLGASATG